MFQEVVEIFVYSVMSRMVDIIFGRVYAHSTLEDISRDATIPVIKYL